MPSLPSKECYIDSDSTSDSDRESSSPDGGAAGPELSPRFVKPDGTCLPARSVVPPTVPCVEDTLRHYLCSGIARETKRCNAIAEPYMRDRYYGTLTPLWRSKLVREGALVLCCGDPRFPEPSALASATGAVHRAPC